MEKKGAPILQSLVYLAVGEYNQAVSKRNTKNRLH